MKLRLSLVFILVFAVGCAHHDDVTLPPAPPCPDHDCPRTNENLDATLYLQTAAEYQAIAHQTFTAARVLAEEGLNDPGWSALGGDVAGKPPAVIVDVDETVLDNSPYQARLIIDDEQYGSTSWKAWVSEARAEAVPGAVEFARWAAANGITMFYVTNRRADEEDATRRNLQSEGFPVRDDIDVVLTRGEREEWGSDKSSRRAVVAESFRVLLLIGDDLGDFVPRNWNGVESRAGIIEANRSRWGRQWLVLPNPTYGSWMSALFDGTDEDADRSETLYEALDPKR